MDCQFVSSVLFVSRTCESSSLRLNAIESAGLSTPALCATNVIVPHPQCKKRECCPPNPNARKLGPISKIVMGVCKFTKGPV